MKKNAVIFISVATGLVFVAIVSLILLGYIDIRFKNPNNTVKNTITVYSVCNGDIADRYDTIMTTPGKDPTVEDLTTLSQDIQELKDYDKDTSCLSIMLATAIYKEDKAMFKETYEKLKNTFYNGGYYVNALVAKHYPLSFFDSVSENLESYDTFMYGARE